VLPAVGKPRTGAGADLAADFDRLWAAGRSPSAGREPVGGRLSSVGREPAADGLSSLGRESAADGLSSAGRETAADLLSAFDGPSAAHGTSSSRTVGASMTGDAPSSHATEVLSAVGDSSSAGGTTVFPTVGEARTGAFRDPWEEPRESGWNGLGAVGDPGSATHDPHEVTVQLDGISLQRDTMLRPAKDGPGAGGEGSDGPVFVDESGRRSRRFRRIGIAVGIACAVYAVVIVATLLSGNSNAPWLPVQGPKEDQPAGQVDTPPLPAESAAQPSGTGSASPGASVSAGDGTTPSPGASGSASSGASAGPEDPGTSADPKPSATKTTPKPGVADPTLDPDPTDAPTTGAPDPTTPTDDPTSEPTETPTVVDPGPGTVADGPSDPKPIAEEQGDSASSTSPSPSPEHTL
jgi:hypothetical protein